MPVKCYSVRLPDVSAVDTQTWASVQADLYSALRAPQMRLLSYINPIDAAEFEAVRRGHMARQKTEMGRRFVEQEARQISLSLRREPAWNMAHYIVVWDKDLRSLGRYLTEGAYPPDPMPAPVTQYTERSQHLHPKQHGLPYVAVLASYDFVPDATWTWQNPWANLITRADGPMLICLDVVRVNEERLRLMKQNLEAQGRMNRDADMTRMAARADAALLAGEEAYEARLVIMLTDTDLERLNQRAVKIINANESQIKLSRLTGQQWQGLEFFSSHPRPSIGHASLASAHSLVLGSGVAVAVSGLAGMNNSVNPNGTYIGFRYGLGDLPLGPQHWNLFTDSNRAAHLGVLGQIGGGKTVAMCALLARYRATEGYPIVYLDPLGNARKLEALLQGRDKQLRYHLLDFPNLRTNILDWLPETMSVEHGLGEQEAHVSSALSVMFGRELRQNPLEPGFLAKALRRLYGNYTPAQLENTALSPRLEHLCEVLYSYSQERFGEHAARLAHEIDGRFVQGGLGSNFNAPSSMPLSFDGADLFDVSAIVSTESGNQSVQQLVYYSIFANFLRVARRDRRNGRRVRRIFAVDEYFRMARSAYLKDRLIDMIKTMRNLFTSVWIAEQNLSELARDASLVANVPHWLVFKQEPTEAQNAPDVFGRNRFPEDYTYLLPRLGQGNCVAMLDDRTALTKIELLPDEFESLVKENHYVPKPIQAQTNGSQRGAQRGGGQSPRSRGEATAIS